MSRLKALHLKTYNLYSLILYHTVFIKQKTAYLFTLTFYRLNPVTRQFIIRVFVKTGKTTITAPKARSDRHKRPSEAL